MAGRKLTKYEKMWRTRRHNARLKKLATVQENERGEIVRTSTKRLKAGTKMAQQFQLIGDRLIIDEMRHASAPQSFDNPSYPISVVLMRDTKGNLVRMSAFEIIEAANALQAVDG